MQDNKTAQMREYLKLKQIQENDESDEIIEEVYNNVITKEDAERDDRGTDIILYIDDDCKEFLEESRIQGLLNKYCRFLPVPVAFGKKKK